MKLKKMTYWVAVAMAAMGGSAHAADITCKITPVNSIITEGQTVQLSANCGTGVIVGSVNWSMNYVNGVEDTKTVTGTVNLTNHVAGQNIVFTTPVSLTSSGSGEFVFTMAGASGSLTIDSNPAQVIVQPAAVLAAASGVVTPTTKINALCGSAGVINAPAVAAMPQGTLACETGKQALAISGPQYFSWSCVSPNGGAETNCFALNSATPTTTTTTTTPTTTTPTTTTPTTTTPTTTTPTTTGGDPGTGSWWPNADRLIADQTGAGVTINYVPGCLNGDSAINSSTGCAVNATNGNFSFGSARTLGLRFTPKAGAGAVKKYFKISSGDGGNVGQSMTVWLSTSPTANYADVASNCRSTSTTVPYILTGPGWCPIDATKKYYLFMSVDATAANPPTWRYQVDEVSADFY